MSRTATVSTFRPPIRLQQSFSRIGITYGFPVHPPSRRPPRRLLHLYQFRRSSGDQLADGSAPHFDHALVHVQHGEPPDQPDGRPGPVHFDGFRGQHPGREREHDQPGDRRKYFHMNPLHRTHVLTFHLLASMITGYGGKFVPPYSPRFMGGEQDIRASKSGGLRRWPSSLRAPR